MTAHDPGTPEFVREMREAEESYAKGEDESRATKRYLPNSTTRTANRVPGVRLTRHAGRDLRRLEQGPDRERINTAFRSLGGAGAGPPPVDDDLS
jgi:hypothetical protein